MRMRLPLLALIACLLFASGVLAQARKTVTGTVRSTEGMPLSGATVNEKGSKTNVLTGENGGFSINVGANATIAISYAGYKPQEIPASGSSPINLTLELSNSAMSEVVVTGFGETRAKRNLGYAVTQISGDDIRRTGNLNPINALRGMVPGLQVSPNVGGPQASTRFLIRGSANLDPYGNQPLVVIDDIVMDDQVILPNRGGDQDFGNILKNLNPDDIETISVLKGGAVTALYGSRASNGVILIKTKKGFSQRGLGVSVAQSFLFERAYKTVDLQNRYGAGIHANDWTRDAAGNLSPNTNYYYSSFGPEMTGQLFTDITGERRANNPGVNDPLSLYGTGVTRNTNVAVSGGNDKTTFRFSFSTLGAKSSTPNNGLTRNNFNLRATHRPIRQILMDINATYVSSDVDNPALQGGNSVIYRTSYGVPRNYDFGYWMNHYINDSLGGISDRDISDANNAFWYIYQNKYNRKESNFRGNFNLRADITKWLRLDGSASFNQIGTNYLAKVRGQSERFTGGDYTTEEQTTQQQRYNGSLNYINKFGDFDILVKGGAEVNKTSGYGVYMSTNGLTIPDLYRMSNNAGSSIDLTEAKPNSTQISSLFFQGSFGYKNYLSLNIYGRKDWNSTLVYNDGHGAYSYFYPGADLALVVSDMVKMPTFTDFAKVRLSYAQVGGGTAPYKTSTGSFTVYNPAYTDVAGNPILRYGFLGSSLPNNSLKPVSNTKFETGIEFKLFKNRLGADITWYQQDSKNQIQDFSVPSASGVRSALINGGKVRNTGIELTLFGTPVKTKDFSWDVLFNYARNRNTIISLPFDAQYAILDQADGIYSVANLGGDYGAIRAPYSYAYYQAKNGSGANIESPMNGMPVVSFAATGGALSNPVMFYQRAGTYNRSVGNDDQPVIGSTLPKFLGSIRNTFNYKRLSLSTFLDAKFGGMVYSTTYGYGSQYGMLNHTLFGRTAELGGLKYQSLTNYNGQTPGERNDGILPVGVFAPNTNIPASASADGQAHDVSGMTVADAYAKGWIKPTPASDYYDRTYGWGSGLRSMSTFESSWVSLREVSVSYEMQQKVAAKVGMTNLRLSLTGTNLIFLYNNAPDHVNPDNLSSTSSGAFIENGGTPYFRQFGFSVNANF